jgi:glycerophosphoryl diester phosphodiesterase
MNFKIIDSRVIGKYDNPFLCEDRIVFTDNFVCVIDGATSKSKLSFGGKKQGIIAGEIIERVINIIPNAVTLEELINTINFEFICFYRSRALYEHMIDNPVDRLSASIAVYSHASKSVWLIGDCQAIIGSEYYTNKKLIDFVLSDLRALIIENYMRNGYSIELLLKKDIGREKILEFLKRQYKFQNVEIDSVFSYGVLDGFPINFKHVKEYSTNNKQIILASDGYPELFKTLKKSEEFLENLLDKDPLCHKIFKSTKGIEDGKISYDDRAYVKIKI